MINAISIALSGLNAATQRLNSTASNIANVTTSGSLEEGGQSPYSALQTTHSAVESGGVRSETIPKDPGFVESFAPDSPFANADGLIGVPNVSLAEEAVNLNLAETTYKANIATLKTSEEMSDELLRIFDEDV